MSLGCSKCRFSSSGCAKCKPLADGGAAAAGGVGQRGHGKQAAPSTALSPSCPARGALPPPGPPAVAKASGLKNKPGRSRRQAAGPAAGDAATRPGPGRRPGAAAATAQATAAAAAAARQVATCPYAAAVARPARWPAGLDLAQDLRVGVGSSPAPGSGMAGGGGGRGGAPPPHPHPHHPSPPPRARRLPTPTDEVSSPLRPAASRLPPAPSPSPRRPPSAPLPSLLPRSPPPRLRRCPTVPLLAHAGAAAVAAAAGSAAALGGDGEARRAFSASPLRGAAWRAASGPLEGTDDSAAADAAAAAVLAAAVDSAAAAVGAATAAAPLPPPPDPAAFLAALNAAADDKGAAKKAAAAAAAAAAAVATTEAVAGQGGDGRRRAAAAPPPAAPPSPRRARRAGGPPPARHQSPPARPLRGEPCPRSGPALPRGADPRASAPGWHPPPSALGLLEETLYADPWRLLAGCILLNKTAAVQARTVVWHMFAALPTPADAAALDDGDGAAALAALLRPLGLHNIRARSLIAFSRAFAAGGWTHPTELPGVGPYAADAYWIFCRGQWEGVRPADKELAAYVQFLTETGGAGTALSRDPPLAVDLGVPPSAPVLARLAAAVRLVQEDAARRKAEKKAAAAARAAAAAAERAAARAAATAAAEEAGRRKPRRRQGFEPMEEDYGAESAPPGKAGRGGRGGGQRPASATGQPPPDDAGPENADAWRALVGPPRSPSPHPDPAAAAGLARLPSGLGGLVTGPASSVLTPAPPPPPVLAAAPVLSVSIGGDGGGGGGGGGPALAHPGLATPTLFGTAAGGLLLRSGPATPEMPPAAGVGA